MELKGYQKEVIGDLREFIKHVDSAKRIDVAFKDFWFDRGVDLGLLGNEYLHPYKNTIPGVPNVTVKVPTAGGKTLIACSSLSTLFEGFPEGKPKVVAWFVPSDTILKQTLKNLKNPLHPYRQKIDSMFGNRVCVVDKEAALMGQGINPSAVMEQLTIFVLSVQSFAANNKEGRRSYRENENLAEYAKFYDSLTKNVEGADETSLIQVLSFLNPVVIIDESHNFTADLRVDALTAINPSFILNLTATPKPNSNIISFVDAIKLKRAHMVKLPVIVYNHKSVEDVIISAIQMQRTLEKKALLEEKENGKYIRPIVLFQAQPRTGEESITFEKIKNNLVDLGIPEDQIKIKTADKDELNRIDLLSKDCPVRFIITVDALKEGWDCPFAYILASLANRTSKISVEQILGRILRLPYTTNHSQELLNLSYVFASSRDFQNTINSIITSLNNAGFSRKDYRAEEDIEISNSDSSNSVEVVPTTLFGGDDEFDSNEESDAESGEIDTQRVKDALGDGLSTPPSIDDAERDDAMSSENASPTSAIEDIALQQNKDYEAQVQSSSDNNSDMPADIRNSLPQGSHIKDFLREDAQKVSLPRFQRLITVESIFEAEQSYIPLEKRMLEEGFNLSLQDHNVSLTATESEAVSLDLGRSGSSEFEIQRKNLNPQQLKAIKQSFSSLPDDAKKRNFARAIARLLKYDSIPEPELIKYVQKAIEGVDNERLTELLEQVLVIAKNFKAKIDQLLHAYRKNTFITWLDTDVIRCVPDYSFPDNNIVKSKLLGASKGLYTDEGDVNGFEQRVITKISELDNVMYWHRNAERGNGFGINGYINHYPDFIIKLKSGRIALIETKGDDRDNSDSRDKIELGEFWSKKAGFSEFKYYMVFDTQKVDGAFTIAELLERLKQL